MSITTSAGTTVSLGVGMNNGTEPVLVVLLDHPIAPRRNVVAGRIHEGMFQAPLYSYAMGPEVLRAIADLIEQREQ